MIDHVLAVAGEVLAQVPDPDPEPPPGLEELGSQVVSWGVWISIITGVVGLIMVAVKMMIGQRGRATVAADGASGLPWVIAGLFLVSASSAIVSALLGF